jgi:hypothetical protein
MLLAAVIDLKRITIRFAGVIHAIGLRFSCR